MGLIDELQKLEDLHRRVGDLSLGAGAYARKPTREAERQLRELLTRDHTLNGGEAGRDRQCGSER